MLFLLPVCLIQNTPGPGTYNIGGDLAPRLVGLDNEPTCVVPFGSQTRVSDLAVPMS